MASYESRFDAHQPWPAIINLCRVIAFLLVGALLTAVPIAQAQAPAPVTCGPDPSPLPPQAKQASGQPDLLVNGTCTVAPGQSYFYGNVNVVNNGKLIFAEPDAAMQTDFYASSVIIENGGALIAGDTSKPIGKNGGVLTIHLYGDPQKNPGLGALCKTPPASGQKNPCGIPLALWQDNGATDGLRVRTNGPLYLDMLAAGETDRFYQYGPLHMDEKCDNGATWQNGSCPNNGNVGYFGNKVIAVSYGATLQLFGDKGSCYNSLCQYSPDASLIRYESVHPSWSRLTASVYPAGNYNNKPGDSVLVVDAPTDREPLKARFVKGDEIVVTATDYLPRHSEALKINDVREDVSRDGNLVYKLTLEKAVQWPHNGERYRLKEKLAYAEDRDFGFDREMVEQGIETRAVVALLNRSIRIVSEGNNAGDPFPESGPGQGCVELDGQGPCYSYGGHLVVRQGFRKLQIQGVEFKQMGQGGRLGHYPVHFHKARKTPPDTVVKDSSINKSMTRWVVLHSTLGVTLWGNVGYKSIGHGYYLEDGTETDNRFYSNVGIFARAAVEDSNNLRKVPGILAANGILLANGDPIINFPYKSNSQFPTIFWITNGWNDFIGNVAAGTGACGSGYWLVPVINSDRPDVPSAGNADPRGHMIWSGYAGLQSDPDNQGATPLRTFYKNYATSSMMSFQTTGDASPCWGVVDPTSSNTQTALRAVRSMAPDPLPAKDRDKDTYYPNALGGFRKATLCPTDATTGKPNCTGIKVCSAGQDANCAVTVLDHFTSSFHWAEGTVSAIWLRSNLWYLFTNSVLTDVQNGGLTFVSGGDYTHSNIIPGFWALAKSSVFIGHTQPQQPDADADKPKPNAFAADAGPFNKTTNLLCDWQTVAQPVPANYCSSNVEGITMPLATAFAVNQRLFNIYDGPAYEDSIAYLDITTTPCPPNQDLKAPGCMYGWGNVAGVRKDPQMGPESCYLPNNAIGWKQPNGFFYPPAFHSKNLYFNNVDIRHYVVNPLFRYTRFFIYTSAQVTVVNGGHGGTNGVQEVTVPNAPDKTGKILRLNVTVANGQMVNIVGLIPPGVEYLEFPPSEQLVVGAGLTGATVKLTPNAYGNDYFRPGATYLTDIELAAKQYCNPSARMFNNFTSVDRQTELNDDDGSLTGLTNDAGTGSISVNQDQFFAAPVETAECLSNSGIQPPATCSSNPVPVANETQTARTSPYDYVYVAVVKSPVDANWSSDCTNPRCYGVPLYRQYLTGTKGTTPQTSTLEWKEWMANECSAPLTDRRICNWPFIRMSGMDFGQRGTLTVNRGKYFMDTSVSESIQKGGSWTTETGQPLVNVFQAGQTYNVFFLYAKPSTQQTYQIYVGSGFNPATMLKAIRAKIPDKNITFADATDSPSWLKIDPNPVDSKGVLTVSVDFSLRGELAPTAANLCKPSNFCASTGNSCTCALKPNDPLIKANPKFADECNQVCKTWAVKDLDCPATGCLGFAFTLPSGFTAANQGTGVDQNVRPPPESFPNWSTTFARTKLRPDGAAPTDNKYKPSSCYYAAVPGPTCSPAR